MQYPAPCRFRENRGVASRRAAFTLTELLVVLIFIFLLAWFLNPFHSHSPEKARQSSCASHMKQIGLAFAGYLADYDDVYPNYDSFKKTITGRPPEPFANVSSDREWYTVIEPYTVASENDNRFRCPSDRSLAPARPKPDRKKEYVTSYSVNGWSEYNLKQSEVRSPGTWILMGERNNEARGPNGPWLFYFWAWQGAPGVWPPAAPIPFEKAAEDLALTRHGERANWLYGDGHVRWEKFSNLWKGGSENPFWPGHLPSPAPSPAP